MTKHYFFTSMACVILQGVSVSAQATYTEQWLSPQQLQQEAARTHRGKPPSTCGSGAARCTSAKPSARPANSHTIARGHPPYRNDPIAAFAANDRVTSRPGHR
jgi:hypothetical protein